MSNQWYELRERLLRAGIAPRHVRRYLAELTDHLTDLRAEEEQAGRTRAEAAAAACARLGSLDQLAHAMEVRSDLRSWSARYPALVFCAGPVFALAAAYLIAVTILWTGWHLYLPDRMTPFVRLRGVEILWFGIGRLIYFAGPVFVGWALGLLALRQRLTFLWPALALALLAVLGSTVHVDASRPRAGRPSHRVTVNLSLSEFHRGGLDRHPSHAVTSELLSPGVLHAALLFTFAALPYVAWRSRRAFALGE